jgi:hypothetical protein
MTSQLTASKDLAGAGLRLGVDSSCLKSSVQLNTVDTPNVRCVSAAWCGPRALQPDASCLCQTYEFESARGVLGVLTALNEKAGVHKADNSADVRERHCC